MPDPPQPPLTHVGAVDGSRPPARAVARIPRAASRALGERGWFLLPQVFSRLSAIVVFALVANSTDTSYLGAFALATAVGAGAQALGPALVAKPLAAVPVEQRNALARPAVSAAVAVGLGAAVLLLSAALAVDGLARTTLVAAGLTAAGVLSLEATFWATVFTSGARTAGTGQAAAYLAQIVVTAAVATLAPGPHLVLVPGATLSVCAVYLVARHRPGPAAAGAWWTRHRREWLPYVVGSAAGIALVQAIPLALAGLVGLAATSLYRAAELVFGPTNLAVSVTGNALLAREQAGRPWDLYWRTGAKLALLALVNGIVLVLAPETLVSVLVGDLADELRSFAAAATLQRTAMAVASIGGILLVPLLSARSNGGLNVASSVVSFAAFVAGLLAGGLLGGFLALAGAEIVFAATFGALVRRRA